MTASPKQYVLFCNEGYGAAFEEAFRRWCRRHTIRRYLIVRNSRDTREQSWRGSVRRLGRALLGGPGPGGADHLVEAEDVNSGGFLRRHLGGGGVRHGIIAGFNQILREPAIGRFTKLLNFHPSVLPYYRGPVPSYWCLRNQEKHTGITLHEVTPQVDAGPILWQKTLPITTSDPDELDRRLSALGAAVLPALLDALENDTALPAGRVDAASVYKHPVDYRSFPPPLET